MSANIHFNGIQSIVLIGGGDLMAESALIFQQKGFEVFAVIAPRHCNEQLVKQPKTLVDSFSENGIKCELIADINQLNSSQLSGLIPEDSAALCFGPAWIFEQHIIKAFRFGMFNINPIPIPHYLGGAHYTWQILNQNREGGCVFQAITTEVDQGDIVAEHKFYISESATTPDDYFIENIEQGLIFIALIADRFTSGTEFTPKPYQTVNQDRVYLPRLRTDKQAYINWQWHRDDIISFCRAFSSPYAGAATFVNQQELRIKSIKAIDLAHPPMHPFAAGVIVRKLNNEVVVSAVGGFVSITELEQTTYQQLREGMRLFTPASILDQAMQYQVQLTADGFKD
ncbi:formyltransferase family protein [Thalassotalea euphylliae]|uniref:Methionyl-tRNA formyltransferase n=1 Tax=Thalassotalea euphylliae TaxID=1655234 RepID=A0A3E0UCT0_9GAMM|nr:formyltransferase family protein [Thalassotalea euphylliae]REL34811.1 hypothetical protein DXX92_05250 [Thalassotalea euphylliae]